MLNNKKAIIEVLKSAARYVWFGLLGIIVLVIAAILATPQVVGATVNIAGMNISIGFIVIAIGSAIAKGIDVYVHKNSNVTLNGIAPPFLQK